MKINFWVAGTFSVPKALPWKGNALKNCSLLFKTVSLGSAALQPRYKPRNIFQAEKRNDP